MYDKFFLTEGIKSFISAAVLPFIFLFWVRVPVTMLLFSFIRSLGYCLFHKFYLTSLPSFMVCILLCTLILLHIFVCSFTANIHSLLIIAFIFILFVSVSEVLVPKSSFILSIINWIISHPIQKPFFLFLCPSFKWVWGFNPFLLSLGTWGVVKVVKKSCVFLVFSTL